MGIALLFAFAGALAVSAGPPAIEFKVGSSVGRYALPAGFCATTGPYSELATLSVSGTDALVLGAAAPCEAMRAGASPTELILITQSKAMLGDTVTDRRALIAAYRAAQPPAEAADQAPARRVTRSLRKDLGPKFKLADRDVRYDFDAECAYVSGKAIGGIGPVKMNTVYVSGLTSAKRRPIMLQYVRYSMWPITDRAGVLAFAQDQCRKLALDNDP